MHQSKAVHDAVLTTLPNVAQCVASVESHAGLLEDGVELGRLGLPRTAFDTFESNVLFVLRYMIDAGVVGGGWVSAPAGKYHVGGAGGSRAKMSTCQLDLHLSYRCGRCAPLRSRLATLFRYRSCCVSQWQATMSPCQLDLHLSYRCA